jgi:molecular chaperone IbpA
MAADQPMTNHVASKENMAMTGFDFSPLFRSSVGFDRLNRLMESTLVPHGDSAYPPYNIEKTGENAYRITVAVAGFGEDELDVTVKENTLTVSGKNAQEEGETRDRTFLHKGIAGRAFRLSFALADAVQVSGANLEKGLLHVTLERVVPEAAKPRTIEIRSAGSRVIENKAA